MAVNGIEIKVGQEWRTRAGEVVKVLSKSGHSTYPFDLSSDISVTPDGRRYVSPADMESAEDLVRLVGISSTEAPASAGTGGSTQRSYLRPGPSAVADGFTPWDSSVQPPDTVSKMVQVAGKTAAPSVVTCPADKPIWSRIGWYKVVGGVPAASTLPTAPDLLDKAAGHMRERAKTYDSPAGERSMAQTVALFNLHHGASLTEAQGWHFMQILKDVRLFSAKGYHADSAEDGIAYKALMAEAKAKEGAL